MTGITRPLTLCFAAVLLSGCAAQSGLSVDSERNGLVSPSSAPPLRGPGVDGGTIDIATMRGHPVVVDVWGSWCGPCRLEQPELNKLFDRYSPKGVDFVGVDIRDNIASAQAYERTFSVQYPSIFDDSEAIAAQWDITAPPTTIVVDKKGNVRARFLGTLTGVSTLLDQLEKE